MEVIHKIGRRKTAVARVYVSEGKGNITVNKKETGVTVSVGVFCCQCETGHPIEDLIRKADEALYRAKRDGRNRVAY